MTEYEFYTEHYPAQGDAKLAQHLYDSGLLFVVNGLLHHYGLALGVQIDETGEAVEGLALNETNDPDGIWFDEETIIAGRRKLRNAGLLP